VLVLPQTNMTGDHPRSEFLLEADRFRSEAEHLRDEAERSLFEALWVRV